ncbi:MAG: bifunctional adenosylcobinamide kinase/adenosylcobinamide-phosphate guanylyltransferase [bacterium]
MGNIIFILGGLKSGKSSFAVKEAQDLSPRVAFIASGIAFDAEMSKRISTHQKGRPSSWDTFEEPGRIAELLKTKCKNYPVIIIDCLTLLINNLMMDETTDDAILSEITNIVHEIDALNGTVIIIANEVGLGIIPDNALARKFGDLAGIANQIVAQKAEEVYLMTAGVPLKIKGDK